MPRSKKSEEKDQKLIKKKTTRIPSSKKPVNTRTNAKEPTTKTPIKTRTNTRKASPPKAEKVIQEELPKQPPKFHEVFPIKLEHKDKRLNENKTCYFQCKEHLDSYLKRYKLKKTEYQISDTEER